MGFFDTIYIVTEERLDTTLINKQWFWDKSEAEQYYDNQLEVENRIVTLYGFDLRTTIEEKLDSLMANRHSSVTISPLQELRSNRTEQTEPDVTWTELRFDPDGSFYFERLKRSSSEHWPYIIEPYEYSNGAQTWRLLDGTTAAPLAIIRPHTVGTNQAFKVVVNGYSQTQAFNDLKSAAIYAATEYNGS